MIFAAAEPFAEGLVESGSALGIDEFLLVQWVAPLASESPEFLVALLFVWRGTASAGLRTLVASKVNQWTLLIGTLGVAYSIALGSVANLPLDTRQTEELFLTSAQSLFALILIANFDLSIKESLVLLATFLLQLFFPSTEVRLVMAGLYVALGIGLLIASPARRATLLQIPAMIREFDHPRPPDARDGGGAGAERPGGPLRTPGHAGARGLAQRGPPARAQAGRSRKAPSPPRRPVRGRRSRSRRRCPRRCSRPARRRRGACRTACSRTDSGAWTAATPSRRRPPRSAPRP